MVATTTQLADLAREVGGNAISVHGILRPHADPHEYEPRPSDVRALADAKLILRSGGDVDGWLGDVVKASGTHAPSVELRALVAPGRKDPHWWQDPRLAQRAVALIAQRMARVDPSGRSGYLRRAARYEARLRRLDSAVAACIGQIPSARRKLVTSHDALGYYARRYGLEVIGTAIPSLSTSVQASAGETTDLIALIRREHVAAVFPEASINAKLERAIAREAHARVGGELWADALGSPGSSGATYVASIAANTAAIVEGLSAGTRRCTPRA